MQVTLKQSEITAAIAAYLTNVLGVSNVSSETLAVVYKQGRSDKNGLTAELDIEAPAYERPKSLGHCGQTEAKSVVIPSEATSASAAQVLEPAPAEAVLASEPSPELTEALTIIGGETAYEGERRAEPRDEMVDNLPEAQPEPEVVVPASERVAELEDEIAQALAEDAAAEAAEAEAGVPVAEVEAAPAAALFG